MPPTLPHFLVISQAKFQILGAEENQMHRRTRRDFLSTLDDTDAVVEDCKENCGVRAFLVDAKRGFQLNDLLDKL